ncbi:RNA polymerase I-specific transcription initiation factor RRN6, partial [Lecanoromycetidae sp. Uapishka_2]
MSNFPSLQPAMTVLVEIANATSIGSASRGTPLSIAPMTGGSIKSESGFSPSIDAQWEGVGADYIHVDPSSTHMRLNAHGAVKDKISGGLIYLNYTGIVGITPALGAILGGSPDAKSTPFGDSFIEMRFETGEEKLKDLELSTFVGAGRFVVEEGKPVTVEYKLSKVVKGN